MILNRSHCFDLVFNFDSELFVECPHTNQFFFLNSKGKGLDIILKSSIFLGIHLFSLMINIIIIFQHADHFLVLYYDLIYLSY